MHNLSGDVAIQRMRDDNLSHVTFSRVASEIAPNDVWGVLTFLREAFTKENFKISLNLFDEYYNWIYLTNDTQPGRDLNLDYFTLIYGLLNDFSQTDSIVSTQDEESIYLNVNSSHKAKFKIKGLIEGLHAGMPKNERKKDYVKKSVTKEVYKDD